MRGVAALRVSGTLGYRRRQVVYWPLSAPFLMVLLFGVLALSVLLQVGSFTLSRLGISPLTASLLLLASLAGSAVNLPLLRLPTRGMEAHRAVSVFGVRYLIPVTERRSTLIAVNAGGALVPAALSGYLIMHDRIGWLALAATAIVATGVHLVARPVRGLGIAVPALLPGALAALTAILLGMLVTGPDPVAVAGLAYASGTLGTLIGADLTNLGKVRGLRTPLASVGGAGTFDGVFLAGVVAVLLASLL